METRAGCIQYAPKSKASKKCFGERGFIGCVSSRELDGIMDLIKPGSVVLDVGCGHCGPLLYLAEKNPQSRFIGIDNDPDRIISARKLISGYENVEVHAGELSFQGIWHKEIDLAIIIDSFTHIEYQQHLLERLNSFMKPGGRIILWDWTLPDELMRFPLFTCLNNAEQFVTVSDCKDMLNRSRFMNVQAIDDTERAAEQIEKWLKSVADDENCLECSYFQHWAMTLMIVEMGILRHFRIIAQRY
ncbi:class I SAM-dependent methyltransferase [Patescibacteria group bacterium]